MKRKNKSKYGPDQLALFRRANALLQLERMAGNVSEGARIFDVARGSVYASTFNERTGERGTVCIRADALTNAELAKALTDQLRRIETNAANEKLSRMIRESAARLWPAQYAKAI